MAATSNAAGVTKRLVFAVCTCMHAERAKDGACGYELTSKSMTDTLDSLLPTWPEHKQTAAEQFTAITMVQYALFATDTVDLYRNVLVLFAHTAGCTASHVALRAKDVSTSVPWPWQMRKACAPSATCLV